MSVIINNIENSSTVTMSTTPIVQTVGASTNNNSLASTNCVKTTVNNYLDTSSPQTLDSPVITNAISTPSVDAFGTIQIGRQTGVVDTGVSIGSSTSLITLCGVLQSIQTTINSAFSYFMTGTNTTRQGNGTNVVCKKILAGKFEMDISPKDIVFSPTSPFITTPVVIITEYGDTTVAPTAIGFRYVTNITTSGFRAFARYTSSGEERRYMNWVAIGK